MASNFDIDDIGYSQNESPVFMSVIAVGRVYERIRSHLPYVPQVRVNKVADIEPVEKILQRTPRENSGFRKENYIQLDAKKPWEIPDEFFEGTDVIAVCSPGAVHDYQVRAAFEKGAELVYSEKPLAPTETRFNEIADWLQKERLDRFLLLNAHYSRKEVAKRMISMLPIFVKAYGRATHVYAQFKDAPRDKFHSDWRGLREHGGLPAELLIHYSTIFNLMGVDSMTLVPPVGLEMEGPYETKVRGMFRVDKGEFFANDAEIEFDLARFSQQVSENKSIRIDFELEDAKVFADFETATLIVEDNGMEVVKARCRGINEYQAMLEELVGMYKHGDPPPLTLEQIEKIHAPIWQIRNAVDSNQIKPYS